MLARKPPSAGPMMKPMPNATPSMPNRAARFSGGVTSATYAPAVLNEDDVMPEIRRPTKRIGIVGASAMTTESAPRPRFERRITGGRPERYASRPRNDAEQDC